MLRHLSRVNACTVFNHPVNRTSVDRYTGSTVNPGHSLMVTEAGGPCARAVLTEGHPSCVLCPLPARPPPWPAPHILQDVFKARKCSWSTGANTAGKDGPKRRLPISSDTKTHASLTWVFWCRHFTLLIGTEHSGSKQTLFVKCYT